jgi:hypothetical protein
VIRKLYFGGLGAIGLAALFGSQTWFEVKTATNVELEFTGIEINGLLGATLVVLVLLTLIAMYLKSRASSALNLIATLMLAATFVSVLLQVSRSDLSSVSGKIEKTTGVASWESQKLSAITDLNVTFWPGLTCLALVVAFLGFVRLTVVSFERLPAKASSSDSRTSEQNGTHEDLWKETSLHS